MAKKFSAQECFDEVVLQVGVLASPGAVTKDQEAVTSLREIAETLAEMVGQTQAGSMVNEFLTSALVSADWASAGKARFAALMKTELPRFREALGVPKVNLADVIWKSAELLTGAFKPGEYRKVVLPLMVLRRLDCLLLPTKDAVLAKHLEISAKGFEPSLFLGKITGFPFWNTSPFTIAKLVDAPDNLRDNIEAMVNGFSLNVRRIFEKFGFMATVGKLEDKQRLYQVLKNFANTPMDALSVSGHDMGKAFEELLRRFNEGSPSDEQYTPRDVIHLMANIVFDGDDEALSVPGAIRTLSDCTAGTGGMLSEGHEKILTFNPNARVRLFGQELEDETYAICMADMLIRGQDPADIALGDTLAYDKFPNERFDYQLSNPPYGREWKPSEEDVRREHTKGALGRFGAGLPRISDGQMLFLQHTIAKMRPLINGEGGGRVGIVHNGSPLFTGDAGSGESEIRRFILEHDYLDAIVALPTDLFYNTNIATYLWFLSNRKPAEREGKVLLIDASNMGVLMKKNMGKKRYELSTDCQDRITQAYHDYQVVDWKDVDATSGRHRTLKAKIFDTSHFFYRKVTIERPLRMRFEVALEKVAEFRKDTSFKKAPGNVQLDRALEGLCNPEGQASWVSAEDFREALLGAGEKSGSGGIASLPKLKAKDFEIARKFFGVRDKKAEITTDEKGAVIPDAELRDAEYIPFSVIKQHGNDVAAGVAAYFDAEVKPHWADAWVNDGVRDESDGQIGIVGCEINFNREFYVYEAPRSRDALRHDIEAMEQRFMEMLKGVAG
jgi:type I restriction enzyme M protein